MKLFMANILAFLFFIPISIQAESDTLTDEKKIEWRMALYQKAEAVTQIPWYYFAAIDQFERNIHEETASKTGIIAITIPEEKWIGYTNPYRKGKQKTGMVEVFDGMGRDGNGDGFADPQNDEDLLQSIAEWLLQYGHTRQDIKTALWDYYQRELSVQTIMNIAKVYQTFNTIKLDEHIFPLPLHVNYTYKNTWGYPRGFGGRRIHEGTDIFANYGVPVRATTYGVIEMKGWNRYGGWRIGIRDIHNIYHYYAHLNGYADDLKKGQVVKPGDVIGYVGASGYGPKGTSGKFPPHLHYGMYRFNGEKEWSFDPYPHLRKWERETKRK
ncbi:peptidase M23-like protein [Melghiribacillus thermohalophilus]|uniref:Peptidase M23-like protein n=1 Tax=Melghiribacillus thermohalophilus TaxID=1324956 RepID=A0A4R3MXT3_9BACI|nr:M23 family metallopeptidase [Melghiribacillus thermohalophilus]TCT19089.1 peptidase M23-like protein [Melghiribacillus thermohalophilus]